MKKLKQLLIAFQGWLLIKIFFINKTQSGNLRPLVKIYLKFWSRLKIGKLGTPYKV